MAYDYLLFDLDGTLTNPREGITKSAQFALRHFGIDEPDLGKLECFIGPPLIDSFKEYYGFEEEKAREGVVWFRKRFTTIGWQENEVLEGIPEMLERLYKQGKHLVVASSKVEEFVQKIMDHFHLSPWFCEIVGATMDETRSAKKDVILEGIRRLGLEGDPNVRERVLMIGDRVHDVDGAHACGLRCMGTYTGFAVPGELEEAGAEYIAGSVAEMGELLSAM